MSEDKPLHVQVAEALGWKWKKAHGSAHRWLCPPVPDRPLDLDPADYPDAAEDSDPIASDAFRYVRRYDTDWRATGPLIEKYRIALRPTRSTNQCVDQLDRLSWDAFIPSGTDRLPAGSDEFNVGATPLVAVCHLILALKAAGKLDA